VAFKVAMFVSEFALVGPTDSITENQDWRIVSPDPHLDGRLIDLVVSERD
jgi:hypothetical protein